MVLTKGLNSAPWLTVQQMMNTKFKLLTPEDSLLTVIRYYQECKVNTLPVVDQDAKLIGVFPKKRLYRALLEGADLDDPIRPYVVCNPVFVSSDLTYNEVSLVVRVTKSQVDYVVVINQDQRVVGMIGTAEYLRESLNVIGKSTTLLESLFSANYEGMIIVDNKGYILRINPAAEGLFGLIESKVKGLHLNEVFPDMQLTNKRILGVKQCHRSVPVIVNHMPICENDRQLGTIITLLDISDAEKIAEEMESVKDIQDMLFGVIDSTSDGVLVSDGSGTVRYINERAMQLFANKIENIDKKSMYKALKIKGAHHVLRSGVSEIEDYEIEGKKCIISHTPIMKVTDGVKEIGGVFSKIYLEENELSEAMALKLLSLQRQVQYYREELEKRSGDEYSFDSIVSNSEEFNAIKKDAQRIARSSSTVLLTGESGVGKDMFARAIHATSPRGKGPFIKVNCAAIPETLFESELFGYAPGSFTGASKKGKPGFFEQANGGTIFLDEIGDTPLSIQVKILQVLQEKQFMRVGGTSLQTVDVRIIAATNRDLRDAISKGAFREDLFYRLNVIEFHLSPLRERSKDIIPLAMTFVVKYNQILGSNVTGISKEAQACLISHSWPGNIRELENAIERAANYVWEGEIGVEHLPPHLLHAAANKPMEPSAYRSVLSDVDKEIIIQALKKAKGNKSAAARMLNMSRSAFYDKLTKYNLS
ncbi:MAG: sigma 54-interacting transcriptional regulator [Firmicutes bacterium]|nr:sigma 54-interacting transcriptional regulator [Bacillota bacterium]